MAYPENLDNVAVFKIHPAIGVARLANNEDCYEFFDYEEKRNAGQVQNLRYMSEQNGNHWMMRQTVQFKIFAYADDGSEIGELSQEIMSRLGLHATWTAHVANRKLHNWPGSDGSAAGSTPVVEAEASAISGETQRLEGDNPWREGKVWLGDIRGDGLFIPPKGGVYRESKDKDIKPYGTRRSYHQLNNGTLDTTSDGSINVTLDGANTIPVIPACVIVAPQQHSPDINPKDINSAPNPRGDNVGANADFIEQTRYLLGIHQDAILTGEGYQMDIAMLNTINASYAPGMEICLADAGHSLPNPSSAFYSRGQQYIHENEIRPSYETGYANYGALTAGLCSNWQTDLNACLNYWTAEFPNFLFFDDDPKKRHLSRKQFLDGRDQDEDRMDNNEDLNKYIDMMGVGRNLRNDVLRPVETERDNRDVAGATPEADFPLDPEQS